MLIPKRGHARPSDASPAWTQALERPSPAGKPMRYTLFCLGPLSNWEPSPFELDGERFHCLEQHFTWRKALFFGDRTKAAEILEAPHAARAKELGRQVAGYDELRWYCAAKGILLHGARHGKYEQHAPSREALLATAGTIVVEAKTQRREMDAWNADNRQREREGLAPRQREEVYLDLWNGIVAPGAKPLGTRIYGYSMRGVAKKAGDGRPSKTLQFPVVEIDSVCEVTDPDAFDSLLVDGVGRARAYGCGMVLVRSAA